MTCSPCVCSLEIRICRTFEFRFLISFFYYNYNYLFSIVFCRLKLFIFQLQGAADKCILHIFPEMNILYFQKYPENEPGPAVQVVYCLPMFFLLSTSRRLAAAADTKACQYLAMPCS